MKMRLCSHTRCSRGSSVTTTSRPLTRCRCKALMLSLDGVVMIHKRGATVSRSGEHRSSLRKDRIRERSSSAIAGWLGNESSCGAPGAGVRSRTSSVAHENGGIPARRSNVVPGKSDCASGYVGADMLGAAAVPSPASPHAGTRRRQATAALRPLTSKPDCLSLTTSSHLQQSSLFVFLVAHPLPYSLSA